MRQTIYDGNGRPIGLEVATQDAGSPDNYTYVYGASYTFNGFDQRVGKADNNGNFNYVFESDDVDAPVLSDGVATYNHGDNGNSLISENRGGASKYYHSDALGSTGALTNSSGTTTDTHVTDAFGMSISGSGSTPTPFGFVGQGGYQSDSDTGLMLCGHRYYDSSTGRFLSRDPEQEGDNWYTYCGNDPLNQLDSTGLSGDGNTPPKPPKKPTVTKPTPTKPPVKTGNGGGNGGNGGKSGGGNGGNGGKSGGTGGSGGGGTANPGLITITHTGTDGGKTVTQIPVPPDDGEVINVTPGGNVTVIIIPISAITKNLKLIDILKEALPAAPTA